MKLYAILDDLEHVSADDLRAEIALCERRIGWCRVFLELLEKQQPAGSAPARQAAVPKPANGAVETNGTAQNGVAKLRAVRNGEPTKWKQAQDLLAAQGPQSTAAIGSELGIGDDRVCSILWKYPQLFRREGDLWRLAHAEE